MEPSDKELLQDSFTTEPTGPAPDETVEVEVTDSPSDRPRDDQGRFVEAPQPPAAEPESVTTGDHRVPLRELLDEREKRQAAALESERLRQQNEHMSRLLMQPQFVQPQQPQGQQQPAGPEPSIWDNPEAYLAARINPYWQQAQAEIMQIREQLFAEKEAMSRERAIDKFGDEAVDAAFNDLAQHMQAGHALHDYARIMQSPHPFGELMRWHQTQVNEREVGGDLNGWLERKLEERMNDPAFQAKVIERARSGSQQQQGGSTVKLPPSLSRAPSSMQILGAEAMDEDDAAILKSSLRR